jgi:hypothetical protein
VKKINYDFEQAAASHETQVIPVVDPHATRTAIALQAGHWRDWCDFGIIADRLLPTPQVDQWEEH